MTIDKVVGLVYIAAFAPDIGESPVSLNPPGDGPSPFTPSADGFLFLNKDAFLHAFAPDVKDNEFLEASQVPYGLAAASGKQTVAAWKNQAELVPALGQRPDHPAGPAAHDGQAGRLDRGGAAGRQPP